MTSDPRQELLRRIPAVEQILRRPGVMRWVEQTSHGFVVHHTQHFLQELRSGILSGRLDSLDPASVESSLEDRIRLDLRPALRAVINATGVVLHTNLGRAPLSAAAQRSLSAVSGQYTNLEYDLAAGGRSFRDSLLERNFAGLLGCEALTVVNNNAAAVFLVPNTLAMGREVVVSRGELIEIGGSFRIPDILAKSGAILREVGTTNKTRLQDYASAIGPGTALLLRVHPSNFHVRGFTEKPDLRELTDLSRRSGVPLFEDIGSGCLSDLTQWGITGEPVAAESVAAGVDLVSFSGDKLMGGPQAGIIGGRRSLVEQIRRNPLMRAFRVDKLVYGALEATVSSYRTGRAFAEIPVLRMISTPVEELASRAQEFARTLGARCGASVRIEVVDARSVVGGGACPDVELQSRALALAGGKHTAAELEAQLRQGDPPIIVRIENDRTLVDLRTVLPGQDELLMDGLCRAV